jgi:hypothetical protein
MDRSRILTLTAALAICLVLTFGFWGCASKAGAPEVVNCPASISWEVAPEARLTQFDCAMGTHDGQASLIFTVAVMNTTDKPLRYRVNIFLEDMDKAQGSLMPAKGKPPVIEPGKTASAKIPFIGVTQESKKILAVVKTMSAE